MTYHRHIIKEMGTNMLTILIFSILRLVVIIHIASCNTLELLRAACPYSKVCTMDSVAGFEASVNFGHLPCCWDCFCDKDCHTHDDCCPDVEDTRIPTSSVDIKTNNLKCVSMFVENGFFLPTEDFMIKKQYFERRYHMLDRCPPSFNNSDDTIGKCLTKGPYIMDYDDAVVVSDSSDRVFKNKHCALCHGVSDITRWNLRVFECADDSLKYKRLSSHVARSYILKNCLIGSVLPTDLVLNSRIMECEKIIVSGCPRRSKNISKEVIDGCENGPFMPYATTAHGGNIVFRNVLCFYCNNKKTDEARNICSSEYVPAFVPARHMSRTAGFSFLLNVDPVDQTKSGKIVNICHEYKVFDFHKKECRDLFCPPYETVSHGTCNPISLHSSFHFPLVIIYWTNESIPIYVTTNMYSKTVIEFYELKVQDLYRQCTIEALVVDLFCKSLATRELGYIRMTVYVIQNENCGTKYIKKTTKQQERMSEKWLINGRWIRLRGHVSFMEGIHGFLCARLINGSIPYEHTARLYMCPYVTLDVEEYNTFIDTVGNHTANKVDEFTITTETVDGSYALSERKIAVCEDVYLNKKSTVNGIYPFCPSFVCLVVPILTLLK